MTNPHPVTTSQQSGRAARVEQWLYTRTSMGARITLTEVRMIAEYVLGYSDQEPWVGEALANAPWLDRLRAGRDGGMNASQAMHVLRTEHWSSDAWTPEVMVRHERCESTLAMCDCDMPGGHDGGHVCDCGGSWSYDGCEPGTVTILAWPDPFQNVPGLPDLPHTERL